MLLPQMVIIMIKVNNYNFKEMSKEEILDILKLNPWFLKDVDNKEIQLEAVKEYGNNIQYIHNPSEEVQLEAVKQDGLSIRFIHNPSDEMKLEAVKQNGSSIRYINNPSEEMQLEAVKENELYIQYINNPCKSVVDYIELNNK